VSQSTTRRKTGRMGQGRKEGRKEGRKAIRWRDGGTCWTRLVHRVCHVDDPEVARGGPSHVV
jgi:hypothetical protein